MNFGEGKLVEAVHKIQGQNDTFFPIKLNIWRFKIHVEFLQWNICDSKSLEPEINPDWPIILFLHHLSEPFYFTTDQRLLLKVAQPYYFTSSNLCYYYCDCYFIVIVVVVTIIEQALDVWFKKTPLCILIMVISMSMKPYRDLIYISRAFSLWYPGVRFLFSQARKVTVNSISWESQL